LSGNSILLPPLQEVINRHGLLAKKSLGQNFLLNQEMTRRIAHIAEDFKDVTVLEIGPGPGGLTRSLLERGAQIVAIERDHRCVDILKELQEAFSGQLEVIDGDALFLKPQQVIPKGRIKIVANLPYNIGTPLLIQWLANLDRICSLTLMFQKEVALRLFAKPRTKDYGRLSILVQWRCEGKRIFDLPPRAFTPAPKVTSSVVHLVPKTMKPSEIALFPIIEKTTQYAFGQRRKMIRTSLKPLFSQDKLITLGLNPCMRAEELCVENYVLLAQNAS